MEPAWARRPLASHRFGIEVEVVVAGDLDTDTLVSALTQLATAGLYKMVSAVIEVRLDGTVHRAFEVPKAVLEAVRPPPDPKVEKALRDIERIIASLKEHPIPYSVVA